MDLRGGGGKQGDSSLSATSTTASPATPQQQYIPPPPLLQYTSAEPHHGHQLHHHHLPNGVIPSSTSTTTTTSLYTSDPVHWQHYPPHQGYHHNQAFPDASSSSSAHPSPILPPQSQHLSAKPASASTLGKRTRDAETSFAGNAASTSASTNTTTVAASSPTTTTTAAPPRKQVKRERGQSVSTISNTTTTNTNTKMASSSGSRGTSKERGSNDDPMPQTSDFVKKLYKMLEDPTFQPVVSWGPQGDCFVVKDMNEFTKSILPRLFKHSNFASFVRQLNKYDFHKVKNTDDNQFGEHSWIFRHPDFQADRRDALENIKRKVPAQRKNAAAAAAAAQQQQQQQQQAAAAAAAALLGGSPSSLGFPPGLAGSLGVAGFGPQGPIGYVQELHSEIRRLKDDNEDLKGRLRNLERNYENVLVEMVGFQRGMAQQDGLMQSLIAYFLGSEGE
ncbi:hypothetical protein CC1G_08281 [Coprinopsis cinerea okayama7|uniref:HSF-type DNA-binding domain-containing protein n=1 Tax=Coprinopsis cinerea (strain Okayama-7 / 130 / ATCC MYA-4618 / FGSC 9003) TaxID=240176 RepID=A8PG35_COPC7|nr:hypothetical protein CC1G_08281 [Coprinopsis cinerea okayama7\|eukprot:XP_001841137.2 hypothetical protein CC1G_08281 [Coprinopsis cinerea okayama7\